MHPTIANGLIGPTCIGSLGIRAARRRGRGSLHPIGISEVHTQGSVKGRCCKFAFEVELGESKL
jgi:hypothetical protein